MVSLRPSDGDGIGVVCGAGFRGMEGKLEDEGCAGGTVWIFGAEVSAVGQGDFAGDGQAEAGAFGAGGEEWLEEVVAGLGGEAGAVVGHAEFDATAGGGELG